MSAPHSVPCSPPTTLLNLGLLRGQSTKRCICEAIQRSRNKAGRETKHKRCKKVTQLQIDLRFFFPIPLRQGRRHTPPETLPFRVYISKFPPSIVPNLCGALRSDILGAAMRSYMNKAQAKRVARVGLAQASQPRPPLSDRARLRHGI